MARPTAKSLDAKLQALTSDDAAENGSEAQHMASADESESGLGVLKYPVLSDPQKRGESRKEHPLSSH
jgi:hypothetical protein